MLGIVKSRDRRNLFLFNLIENGDVIFSEDINSFYQIDKLIIPYLGIDEKLYCKGTNICLKDVYKQNPLLYLIITGVASEVLKKFCKDNNINLIILNDNEKLVMKNAKLTAEGIIKYISIDNDCSISDIKILILGYGNIAYNLIDIIRGYGGDASIYSESIIEKKFAKLKEINVLKNLNNISDFELIINTIPAHIIKEENYHMLNNKRIIDVSSYPFGFDFEKLKSSGIKYEFLPGIPGNMMPYSAAKNILNEINEII